MSVKYINFKIKHVCFVKFNKSYKIFFWNAKQEFVSCDRNYLLLSGHMTWFERTYNINTLHTFNCGQVSIGDVIFSKIIWILILNYPVDTQPKLQVNKTSIWCQEGIWTPYQYSMWSMCPLSKQHSFWQSALSIKSTTLTDLVIFIIHLFLNA